ESAQRTQGVIAQFAEETRAHIKRSQTSWLCGFLLQGVHDAFRIPGNRPERNDRKPSPPTPRARVAGARDAGSWAQRMNRNGLRGKGVFGMRAAIEGEQLGGEFVFGHIAPDGLFTARFRHAAKMLIAAFQPIVRGGVIWIGSQRLTERRRRLFIVAELEKNLAEIELKRRVFR